MDIKLEERLRDPKVLKRIIDIVNMSDYDFYTKLCSGISEEEYEELCKEFPEAKEIDRSVLGNSMIISKSP